MSNNKVIGMRERIDGESVFRPGMIEDCLVFKDRFAFRNWPSAVCYVPDDSFGRFMNEDGVVNLIAHEGSGCTARDIVGHCWGNFDIAEYYFNRCVGEDIIQLIEDDDSFDDEDFRGFYSFVKKGAIVWWKDPEAKTTGMYCVLEEPKGEEWDADSIVLISNGTGEAEVTLIELTQPRFVLMHRGDDIMQVKIASNWIMDLTDWISYSEDEEKHDKWIIRRFPLRD